MGATFSHDHQAVTHVLGYVTSNVVYLKKLVKQKCVTYMTNSNE